METNQKEIIFVCLANYCRSPVAEKLFQHYYPQFNFKSAGISPKHSIGMDIRSEKFLKLKKINDLHHVPKKINSSMVSNATTVICLDFFILGKLNSMFSGHHEKIKLFNFGYPNLRVYDPYTFNEKKYFEQMERIEYLCKKFDLNIFI